MTKTSRLASGAVAAALLLGASAAFAQQPRTLRIAMTATDVPTTTGMPNNGFEGVRFLGYPVFESLVLWDLSRGDQVAGLRALVDEYEQLLNGPRELTILWAPGSGEPKVLGQHAAIRPDSGSVHDLLDFDA